MRQRYANKMYRLLNNNGILSACCLIESLKTSLPLERSRAEYENLFKAAFTFNRIEHLPESVEKRAGNELFIELQKDDSINVALYAIDGITCSNCSKTIVGQFMTVDGVLNCSISTDFKELLLVSSREIPIESLRQILAYDKKYQIEPKN
jgi:CRISPR/Cas system CMR-associated protein Cmr5 small subunit